MQKVRYGVVGAGWISQIAFMPAVAQTGNSEMTCIVSGNAETAAKLASFHQVPQVISYQQYDEMLAADIVDAVYIALPNSLHADYAIRAAKAGKHVLVEKPLAISIEQCEAMIAAADKADVRLMTAYRLHHDPATVELLEQIRQGAIGEPKYFTSMFSFQSELGNHRLKAEHWGGPLQDIGIYCLNAARHIFAAEPVEAFAMKGHGQDDPRFTEVEATIAVTLRFPGARFAQFIASFDADSIDTYRVVGSTGELTMEPGFQFLTDTAVRLRQNEATVFEKPSPGYDHFGAQTAYFSDCILNGTAPAADGAEGLADVRAMLAIERAAATGQPQAIDDRALRFGPTPDMIRPIPRTDRRLVF